MMRSVTQALRDDILQELDADPRLNAARIGVTAEDGVVTLSGPVSTLAEKWAAEEAAKRVKGVRAVVERLDVDPPAMHRRDDGDIARAIANLFSWSPVVPRSVQASVQDGRVTLTGEVEWNYQRDEAEFAVVRNVAGVTGLSNHITLRVQPAEKDIRKELHRALHRSAQMDADCIDIEVDRGEVTLTGIVRSRFERDEAARAAWSIRGVHTVRNDILVKEF